MAGRGNASTLAESTITVQVMAKIGFMMVLLCLYASRS